MNLELLDPVEAERLAYADGHADVARAYARIADLEHTIARYECALRAIVDGGDTRTMTAKQCAGAAREVLHATR
jgi:hypothetical protein